VAFIFAACSTKAGNPLTPSVSAPVSSGAQIVRECRAITTPGTYTLDADLSSSLSACLTISNVTAVTIDCGGHSISSIGPMPNGGYALTIKGSSSVTVQSCTFLGSISIDASRESRIVHNRIVGSYTQNASSSTTFADNTVTFDPSKPAASGIVALFSGSGNTVEDNRLDGAWDGDASHWGRQGSDDGVQLTNESGDVVQRNSIQNVYDAGIEGIGVLNNTLIANNTIINSGYTGIGSYHGTNWTGDTIRGNEVSRSPCFASIEFTDNRQDASITSAIFQNNLFESNRFRSPIARPPGFVGAIPAPLVIRLDPPPAFPVIAGNNVIRNNDLEAAGAGTLLYPADAFVH